jgi:hypothetical protein
MMNAEFQEEILNAEQQERQFYWAAHAIQHSSFIIQHFLKPGV